MVTSDFLPEVKIRPFRACAMHPAIIIGTVRSLWTWLWGRYHVPQNAFLVVNAFLFTKKLPTDCAKSFLCQTNLSAKYQFIDHFLYHIWQYKKGNVPHY